MFSKFHEEGKRKCLVSPAPHPSQKLSRTGHPNLQGAFHSRTIQYSQGLPAPSMVPNSSTRQSHNKITLKIPHELKTIWVCTTAWRIQLRRHVTSPAWYTSDYSWKVNCERNVGIPWSKGMVSRSLNGPLLVTSRLCNQNKRRTRLRLRRIFPT